MLAHTSLIVSLHGGMGKGALWEPLTRVLIPFISTPPSKPNQLPKASPSNTTTLRVSFQHIILERTHTAYSMHSVAKLNPTLCDPMNRSPPDSSVHPLCKEYQSGLPFPPPGHLPHPGIEPMLRHWQADSLSLSHLGSPPVYSSGFWVFDPFFNYVFSSLLSFNSFLCILDNRALSGKCFANISSSL